MATVRTRARGDGTVAYQVIYYHRGRQRFQTHDTLPSANKAADLIDRIGVDAALEVLDARDGRTDAMAPTLAQWMAVHVEALTNVTEGTRHRYEMVIANDLGNLSDLPIDFITEEAVAAWVNAMRRKGLSSKTIANKQSLVSSALARAAKKDMVRRNVAHGIRAPKDMKEEMTFLTPEEMDKLIRFIRPTERGMVYTLAATGMRWGEMSALQVRDWNPRQRTLTIVRAWKEAVKGVELGAPKSQKSRRTIEVPGFIGDILDAATQGKDPEDFIFLTPKGVPWKNAGHFHEFVWQPALAAANGQMHVSARTKRRSATFDPLAGKPWLVPAERHERLGKRPRVHDLRHTAASWMIQANVPLPVIQQHLGHESITTTVDRYGHLSPASRAMAAFALGAALDASLGAGRDAGLDPTLDLGTGETLPEIRVAEIEAHA